MGTGAAHKRTTTSAFPYTDQDGLVQTKSGGRLGQPSRKKMNHTGFDVTGSQL